jgi:ABC-2 type transport system permease protein
VTLCGTLAGMLVANQFAYDGTAYASHLLAQVPGRVQMLARAVAVGIVSLPIQLAVVVAVSVLAHSADQLPAGLGLLATAFGVSVAVAGLMSVLAPYPLPESTNPFALNSGGGGAKGLLALVALVATLVLSGPMLALAYYLSPWLILVIGLAYGLLAARLGAIIGGDRLDRRGPELLAAVSPKR